MTPTADLSDANADGVVHCRPIFRNFGGRAHFHGPIATVSCLEDNVLYEQALGTSNRAPSSWSTAADRWAAR